MSGFKVFAEKISQHVKGMVVGETHLFKTSATKEELWDCYMSSFPEGTNEIFKERAEHDCVYCKQFVRPCGGVVAIKDNKLISIWDAEGIEYPYDIVAKAMSDLVKSKPIRDVFVTRDTKFGTASNKQQLEDGSIVTWNHFHMSIPKSLTITRGTSPESVMAEFKSAKEVFERSLREITLEAANTILELISQSTLYRGEEHKKTIQAFIKFKKAYDLAPEDQMDAWLWKTSIKNPVCRIRNSAIGTLLVNLSEDMDLDLAVRKFEKVVAPSNYKRPKAIFTKRMVEEAEAKIIDLGMLDSLSRCHASLNGIRINNVLFVNRDAKEKITGGNMFDSLKEDSAVINPKTLNKVEEIPIKDFLTGVLPTAKRIELLLEGKLQNNFVSLIAPQVRDSKSMFKWNNNFSWSYCSDTADSMKQHVKSAGGKVDGVLRFSIQWNDDRGKNLNDYDAHCCQPGKGGLISYQNKNRHASGGNLDVDIVRPNGVAVENITWPSVSRMEEGIYKFQVHTYSHNGGTNGFDAEIEFDGQVFSFAYHKDLPGNKKVTVAEVKYTKANGFEMVSSMDSSMNVNKIWGVTTNRWVDVSTLMYSPNYWDGQEGTGNRHYFFMLKNCINESNPRGFYNEFLREDLNVHRKVFEALGSKARVEDSSEQLSGLGFSETQRNNVFVRVEGAFTRVLKVLF